MKFAFKNKRVPIKNKLKIFIYSQSKIYKLKSWEKWVFQELWEFYKPLFYLEVFFLPKIKIGNPLFAGSMP